LSQQHVLNPTTVDELRHSIDHMVTACIEFKLSRPHMIPPTDMDREALRCAAGVTDEGVGLAAIVSEFVDEVLPASLNFAAPTFLAHPDAGNSMAGIVGDVANAFLHQNLSSFDYGPAATVLEVDLLHTLRRIIGYPSPDSRDTALSAGAAVVFGGAGANFSCLLAAREHLKRQLAAQGRTFDPRRTRVLANRPFTHFSLRRSLHMLGLGNRDLDAPTRASAGLEEESLRDVASLRFQIDIDDLERQIEAVHARGEDIMCIFAVAGDSRFMAFDNLVRINEIAQRHQLWVHVDACEGGQVLFSPRRRHLMEGIEGAHSISMDPHKVLLLPYNVSLFFLRDPHWLTYFSGDPATVINQDEMSLGGYTPAINSKGFISLKMLFMLKHWGWRRLAEEIDRRHELALQTAKWITGQSNLRLINPDVRHNAVAFMYVPDDARVGDPEALNRLNKSLHQRLNMQTQYFVHGFPARDDEARIRSDKGTVYALRMMFGNPLSQWQQVRECLEAVVKIGFELSGEMFHHEQAAT
jgi:L-2,4-diaminobutyrate decarboxylase